MDAPTEHQVARRQQNAAVVVQVVTLVLQLIHRHNERQIARHILEEERVRPGIPTTLYDPSRGLSEVNNILNYDEQYCRSTTRLHQEVLKALVEKLRDYGLEDTAHGRIRIEEKVIMFLDYCAHKKTYREMRRVYQHSFKTFTRHIKAVALALTRLYKDTIVGKPNTTTVHESILESDRMRYFRGCVGALDGSHVPFRAHRVDMGPWRNRKGWHSQNVLYACDLDMNIVFTQPGYKGSANDGEVLKRAIRNGLNVPTTHYFLGDGGYSKKHRMVLVPYQKTRYHLREIQDARQRPETKEELFNLRHAVMRNVIERLIGVMKKRWRVLRDGPEIGFTPAIQSLFVYALAAVHNFALEHGQTVEEDEEFLGTGGDTDNPGDEDEDDTGVQGGALANNTMVTFRDRIAEQMWEDYQNRTM